MATPLSSISGLISGIDYKSLVDQIIAAEGRPARRLRDQATLLGTRKTALATYRGLLADLQAAAKGLRDGTAFDAVSTSTAVVSGTRALVSASAGSNAAFGTYRIEVTNLAQAQKLGSTAFASQTDPLGLAAGSFSVNGVVVNVDANDTLISLRDKLNAANTGAGASKVSASVLQVGANQHRLVLTSDVTGAAGMTLADVSGGVLQALGFTDASGAIQPSAVLVAGRDANFRVDGQPIIRSSNTVTDVIQGVTLTLTAEETGAVTAVTVERSLDGARAAMKSFVDAWNKLVDFTNDQRRAPPQGTAPPPLYTDPLVRTVASTLSRTLLSQVAGAPADLSTAGLAGVSLGQDGKLTLDTTRFDAAFKNRPADLRTLFSQVGTTTDARLSYVSSSAATAAGTWAVNITQAATRATATGAGFSGTYADDATADLLTVTDASTGTAVTVQLVNGMTTANIVDALNAAFAAATKQRVATSNTLYSDAAGTVPMTAATTFGSLRGAGGATLGVAAGDTISYSGTRPDGSTFTGTFSITDPASTTVGQLVSQLQAQFGTAATVSVSNGTIVVEDAQARTSPLTFTLTANNEGGGTLAFGGPLVAATGRPAVALTASAVGAEVRISADAWGSAPGFTLAFTPGGADSTAQLGLTAGTYRGLDVQGTIGGNAATGAGRTLTGAAGTTVDGLVLTYTGTSAGSAGTVSVTLGTGALLERALDRWLEANTGTLRSKDSALDLRIQALEDRASQIDVRLEQRRASLLKQFSQMEMALSRLQSQSSGLSAMLGALTQGAK